jgi:hypothetical protein
MPPQQPYGLLDLLIQRFGFGAHENFLKIKRLDTYTGDGQM